jgi:hypothetical protein
MRGLQTYRVVLTNSIATTTLVSLITARGLSMTEVENMQPGHLCGAWMNFTGSFVTTHTVVRISSPKEKVGALLVNH